MNTNNYVKLINTSVKLSAVFIELEETLQKIDQSITLSIDITTNIVGGATYNIYLDAGNVDKFDLMFIKIAKLTYDPVAEKFYLLLTQNKEKPLYELNFMSIMIDLVKEAKDIIKAHTKGD